MHEKAITKQSWFKNYKIKKVFYKGFLYSATLKYLKNQKYLKYSKIFFLLNSFIVKRYPVCYVLTYKNKIVGFVGTFFSEKIFFKKKYLTCNIHSWLVNHNHRIVSKLLFDEIDKKNCLITILSSLPRLRNTFIRLGYKELILKYRLVLIKKFFIKKKNFKLEIIKNYNFKNFSEKKIALAYQSKKYLKIFLKNKYSKKECFIIGSLTYKKKLFKTFNIIFCSNKDFLNDNLLDFFDLISINYNVTFCGDFFLKKQDSYLKVDKKYSFIRDKKVFFKNMPKKFTFDLLYSETEF